MTYFIRVSFIFLILIGFLGCQNFLDIKPTGNVEAEEFYQTLNDLQLGLNATYNILATDMFQKSEWLFGEGCGDDVLRTASLSPSSEEGLLIHFNFTPRNSWIRNRWEINYQGIFRANWVISKALELPSDQINILDEQAFLPIIVGQAKFLRALFYFNLVKTYGGVPIKPERININGNQDNTVQPRSTVEEVYQYIERDLREALIAVDDRYDQDNFQEGKADKGAVAALLMKVLAYQARSSVKDPKWQEVREMGEYLVDRRRLTYREILRYETLYDNEKNPETWSDIKERLGLRFAGGTTDEEQLANLAENSRVYSLNFPYELMWIDQGEFHPGSIFEVGHFELRETNYSVGTAWDNNLGRGSTAGWLQPGVYFRNKALSDPRAAFVFATGSQTNLDYVCNQEGVISGAQPDPFKSYCIKWYQPSCQRPTSGSANSGRNFRMMRYGEVKLFFAEALNELGDRQTAINQIRDLWERANRIGARFNDGRFRNTDNLRLDTYENIRDLIWEERRLELAFEFDRFWDIVRQGKAAKFMAFYNSDAAAFGSLWSKNFTPGINEIFPIPQDEIDLSNGIVLQNPGY